MDTLRVGEFASLLGVNPRSVRRWLTRGLLPYIELPGGERRIHKSALDAILAGKKAATGGSRG